MQQLTFREQKDRMLQTAIGETEKMLDALKLMKNDDNMSVKDAAKNCGANMQFLQSTMERSFTIVKKQERRKEADLLESKYGALYQAVLEIKPKYLLQQTIPSDYKKRVKETLENCYCGSVEDKTMMEPFIQGMADSLDSDEGRLMLPEDVLTMMRSKENVYTLLKSGKPPELSDREAVWKTKGANVSEIGMTPKTLRDIYALTKIQTVFDLASEIAEGTCAKDIVTRRNKSAVKMLNLWCIRNLYRTADETVKMVKDCNNLDAASCSSMFTGRG